MNDEKIKVRFLAVDTPETKHPTKGEEPYGKEASNYTCNKLKNAKKIVLEFDKNSEKKDKYDRYLAWIIVDNNILQEELISNGLAKVAYLYGDYKYTNNLKKLEKEAKKDKIGIWNNYENNDDFSLYILIVIIIIVIIMCIFNKNYRKKTTRIIKKETNSFIKKQLKKSNLFK